VQVLEEADEVLAIGRLDEYMVEERSDTGYVSRLAARGAGYRERERERERESVKSSFSLE